MPCSSSDLGRSYMRSCSRNSDVRSALSDILTKNSFNEITMVEKTALILANFICLCAAFNPRICPFAPRNILPDHEQNLGDFCEPPKSAPCDLETVYYSLDGSCNNLNFSFWGQAGTPFTRMVEAHYSDGICGVRSGALPLVRQIRTSLFTSHQKPSTYFNILYYAFGEYMSHDASSQIPIESKEKCCQDDASPEICLPIRIPQDDPFYAKHNVTCLEMTRSTNTHHNQRCQISPCLPINFQTAVLDLSILYGTDEKRAKKLRSFQYGHLLYEDRGGQGDEILPPTVRGKEFCPKGGIEPGAGKTCMASGDYRTNQNPEITVMDIIFLRMHNYIADTLLKYNPHWNDEKLFQEARRVLIALYQHILMSELVPHTLGAATMSSYGLLPVSSGYSYTAYDPNINTQTTVEYSFAAGRSHHSMVKGNVGYLDSNGEQTSYKLRDSYYNAKFMLQKNIPTNLVAAYLEQRANQATKYFDEDAIPGSAYGLDLISLDIYRGLDAGVPTYNAMRQACGLCRLNDFEDLTLELVEPTDVPKLKNLYSTVDEIDFYVGGLLERPIEGGTVGPTFACVMAENFFRWKTGDRLYYEFPTAKFTLAQLNAIRNATTAWLLCKSDPQLQFIPQNAFLIPSDNNPLINCVNMENVDFSVFKVEKTKQEGSAK